MTNQPVSPEPRTEAEIPAIDMGDMLAEVAAWRAFSDRFMDPTYRNDPNASHIRDAFAAGWDAAIASLRGEK